MIATGVLEVSQLYKSLSEVSENWEVIRDEMRAIPKDELNHPSKNVRLYDVDPTKWCHYVLKFRGSWTKKGIKNCPKTYELIKDIPYLFRVAFMTMHPHTFLHPHVGDYRKAEEGYKKIWRYHLGLDMASEDRPYAGMVIGDQVQRWGVGESFMFNDGEIHSAWNYGKQPRTILCVDLLYS